MNKLDRTVVICLYLWFLFPVAAPAQDSKPTYTKFDAPGAGTAANQGTVANSINTAGAVAGWYIDAANANHGFVRSNGTITTFDAPGAGTGANQGTFAYSINTGGGRSRDGTLTRPMWATASYVLPMAQ
jgi:hypothetical protein